jgi:hypothetical protein
MQFVFVYIRLHRMHHNLLQFVTMLPSVWWKNVLHPAAISVWVYNFVLVTTLCITREKFSIVPKRKHCASR